MTRPASCGPIGSRCLARTLLLALLALSLAACSTLNPIATSSGEPVKLLKIDPTDEPAMVKSGGTRWVLFKLDIGGRTRKAIRGAATVGQSVGASVARLSPEDQILNLIQSTRESARIDQARAAVSAAAPSLPLSFVR